MFGTTSQFFVQKFKGLWYELRILRQKFDYSYLEEFWKFWQYFFKTIFIKNTIFIWVWNFFFYFFQKYLCTGFHLFLGWILDIPWWETVFFNLLTTIKKHLLVMKSTVVRNPIQSVCPKSVLVYMLHSLEKQDKSPTSRYTGQILYCIVLHTWHYYWVCLLLLLTSGGFRGKSEVYTKNLVVQLCYLIAFRPHIA